MPAKTEQSKADDPAAVAEAEQAAAQEAADKRASEREKAAAKADGPPPTEKDTANGVAFSVGRLIEQGHELLGQPPYVVSGALHESKKEYLTVDEAQKLVAAFLGE